MQIEIDNSNYDPVEYGENDDILTVFVKSMGGLTLVLLGGSLLAMLLLSQRNKSKGKIK